MSAVDKAAAFILTPIPSFVTALRPLSKKQAIFTHCACLRKGLQVLRQPLRKEKTSSVEHLEAPLRGRVEAEMVYSDCPRLCDGRANHDEAWPNPDRSVMPLSDKLCRIFFSHIQSLARNDGAGANQVLSAFGGKSTYLKRSSVRCGQP